MAMCNLEVWDFDSAEKLGEKEKYYYGTYPISRSGPQIEAVRLCWRNT